MPWVLCWGRGAYFRQGKSAKKGMKRSNLVGAVGTEVCFVGKVISGAGGKHDPGLQYGRCDLGEKLGLDWGEVGSSQEGKLGPVCGEVRETLMAVVRMPSNVNLYLFHTQCLVH